MSIPYICICIRLELSTWANSKVLSLAFEVEIAPTIMITRAKPQTGLCQGLQKTTTYAKCYPAIRSKPHYVRSKECVVYDVYPLRFSRSHKEIYKGIAKSNAMKGKGGGKKKRVIK